MRKENMLVTKENMLVTITALVLVPSIQTQVMVIELTTKFLQLVNLRKYFIFHPLNPMIIKPQMIILCNYHHHNHYIR